MQTAREESSIIIFGENLLRPERVTGENARKQVVSRGIVPIPWRGRPKSNTAQYSLKLMNVERQNQDTLYQMEFDFDTPSGEVRPHEAVRVRPPQLRHRGSNKRSRRGGRN